MSEFVILSNYCSISDYKIYLISKHWNEKDKNDFLTTEILIVSLLPINCLNVKLLLKSL